MLLQLVKAETIIIKQMNLLKNSIIYLGGLKELLLSCVLNY
jgi:hypothetical protein